MLLRVGSTRHGAMGQAKGPVILPYGYADCESLAVRRGIPLSAHAIMLLRSGFLFTPQSKVRVKYRLSERDLPRA
jgi:hypothetical protein